MTELITDADIGAADDARHDVPGLSADPFPLPVSVPPSNPGLAPDIVPVPAQRIAVAFAGDASGVAQLTWGQREIVQVMSRQGWLCLGGTLPLAPGTTVEDVADELRFMMSRFPSLRTKLRFDTPGDPTQELHSSGEITLEVFDTEQEPDQAEAQNAAQTAARVEAHYRTMPRDFAEQWPIRMAVVRYRGTPTHLVVLSCHMVADNIGLQLLSRQTAERQTEPPIGTQQLDLAAWQCSPAGRRVSESAMRYLAKVLASTTPQDLPISDDRREPRHWTGELVSPALQLAVPVIAERTGADSSSVLLTLYAVALSRRGIHNPAIIKALSGNRFRPGLSQLVSDVTQSAICVLDVSEKTIDDAVRLVRQISMAGYKHGYFDPRDETALLERLARQSRENDPLARVWTISDWVFFNDRRDAQSRAIPAMPVTEQSLRDAVSRGTFRWTEKKENPYEQLFVHIDTAADGIAILVCADTHHISPAENEALAREVEAAAVEAALDPAALTRVPSATQMVR